MFSKNYICKEEKYNNDSELKKEYTHLNYFLKQLNYEGINFSKLDECYKCVENLDHKNIEIKNFKNKMLKERSILSKINCDFFNFDKNIFKKTIIDEKECQICFDKKIDVVLKNCGHTGCNDCFQKSILIIGSCPICRKNCTQEDIIKIYL